jgi:hypothetical protein
MTQLGKWKTYFQGLIFEFEVVVDIIEARLRDLVSENESYKIYQIYTFNQ